MPSSHANPQSLHPLHLPAARALWQLVGQCQQRPHGCLRQQGRKEHQDRDARRWHPEGVCVWLWRCTMPVRAPPVDIPNSLPPIALPQGRSSSLSPIDEKYLSPTSEGQPRFVSVWGKWLSHPAWERESSPDPTGTARVCRSRRRGRRTSRRPPRRRPRCRRPARRRPPASASLLRRQPPPIRSSTPPRPTRASLPAAALDDCPVTIDDADVDASPGRRAFVRVDTR